MLRKLSGSATVAMGMFLVSGVLVSVLGVRQVERHNTEDAWVMQGDWPKGVTVQQGMLRKARLEKSQGGIQNAGLLVGKRLTADKRDGDVIKASDLQAQERRWLAKQVPAGRVLYSFTPRSGTIPHSQLRNGDRFDILASGRAGVRVVAKDVRLVGVMKHKSKQSGMQDGLSRLLLPALPQDADATARASLVIAVEPDDVFPLARTGQHEAISIVLHGAHAGATGFTADIEPPPTQRTIELLSGLKRKTVAVDL